MTEQEFNNLQTGNCIKYMEHNIRYEKYGAKHIILSIGTDTYGKNLITKNIKSKETYIVWQSNYYKWDISEITDLEKVKYL